MDEYHLIGLITLSLRDLKEEMEALDKKSNKKICLYGLDSEEVSMSLSDAFEAREKEQFYQGQLVAFQHVLNLINQFGTSTSKGGVL